MLLSFMLMTGFLWNPGAAPANVAVPPELLGIQHMTTWNVSRQQQERSLPADTCGIRNPVDYDIVRMDHDVNPSIDDAAATREIKALDDRIVRYLKQRRWLAMQLGGYHGGIPNHTRCYRRQRLIVQIYETTGRCTMSTSCRAFDGFTVVTYSPKK